MVFINAPNDPSRERRVSGAHTFFVLEPWPPPRPSPSNPGWRQILLISASICGAHHHLRTITWRTQPTSHSQRSDNDSVRSHRASSLSSSSALKAISKMSKRNSGTERAAGTKVDGLW